MQRNLMEEIATLVPTVLSLKDLLACISGIEELLAGKQTDSEVTPTEALRDWLNAEETTQ